MAKQIVMENGSPINMSDVTKIKAQKGEHYRIVVDEGSEKKLMDDVIVRQVNDDLVLNYADNSEVVIQDYFFMGSAIYVRVVYHISVLSKRLNKGFCL